MKRRLLFAVLILALFAVLVFAAQSIIFAQTGCPPASYTSQVFPWAQGTTVNFSFDVNGLGVQDNSNPNPPPKFSLSDGDVQSWTSGIQQWNQSNQSDGTNVTFNPSSGGTFPWIISVAWPNAKVTYTASNGQSYTFSINASCSPQPCTDAVAVTQYLPDHNSSGGFTGIAAAAVTLINTNGAYSVGGNTYPDFDPNGANFLSAQEGLGSHETGHGFGLDDQSGCGDVNTSGASHWF